MTNPNDVGAEIMLFGHWKTDKGTELSDGAKGTISERVGDDFLIKFPIADVVVDVDVRYETVRLSSDMFAIVESPPAPTE
ncbi:MAG: hypothetical protein ACXABY_18705 [Candidatus Thorarchaeota archaeon]|jgi:hypothetical protein